MTPLDMSFFLNKGNEDCCWYNYKIILQNTKYNQFFEGTFSVFFICNKLNLHTHLVSFKPPSFGCRVYESSAREGEHRARPC